MAKKNMQSIVTALTPVAEELPTQNVQRQQSAKTKAAGFNEPVVQFGFGLRKSLRKQLGRLADDADMTMRSFVLGALKEKGLEVTDDDLLDLRKER